MTTSHVTLCQYRYDALDLLVGLEPADGSSSQRFYRQQQLVTETKGQASESVFRQGDHLLALQSNSGDSLKSRLLVADQQRSVLQLSSPLSSRVYTAYGHDRAESLLGFTGERRDPVTGHYLLGNGHRAFNPILMRFNCPDRLSPFGRGGLNPYAYCLGDPVNFTDPSGQFIDKIVRAGTALTGLTNSGLVLKTAIPFKLGSRAMQWGAAGHLPAKYVVGAAGATIAGVTTVLAALTGVGAAVAAINEDTEAAAKFGIIALVLGVLTLTGRIGSRWAASDPKTIPALKKFVDNRGQVAAGDPTGPASSQSPSLPQDPSEIARSGSSRTPTSVRSPEPGHGVKRKYDDIDGPGSISVEQSGRHILTAMRIQQGTLTAKRIRQSTA